MKRVVIIQWIAVLAIGVGIGYAAGLGQWINAMTTGEQGATGTNIAAPCCCQHGEAADSASTMVSLPGTEGALPSCCSQGVSRTKMMAAAAEKPVNNSSAETASTETPSETPIP